MSPTTSSLLESDAVFPRPEGGIRWVPPRLPLDVSEDELSMTVAEFIARYGAP